MIKKFKLYVGFFIIIPIFSDFVWILTLSLIRFLRTHNQYLTTYHIAD